MNMRIDGTDATDVTFAALQKIDSSTKDIPVKEMPTATKDRSQDIMSLNQLTDLERRGELSISDRVVIEAIERANRAISGANRRFEFSIHEKTKQIMVKVINSDTNELVREIPPEKILDMVARMWEMAGILVDERR
jgi:flagellar protein FlaG